MGLGRVALFVSYLCLLQCDLYQARAVDKDETMVKIQMPVYSMTFYKGPNQEGTVDTTQCKGKVCPNRKKPTAMVLELPSPGSKARKTKILIDMTGKSKNCQYSSDGQILKNETLNVDVYVTDKQNSTNTSNDSGYITTLSNSSIEDSKEGIKVIGYSKSSTPDSNLTVFVKVYLVENDTKDESGGQIITTNSSVSDAKGNVADAVTGAEESDGSSEGSSSNTSDGSSSLGSSGSSSDGGSSDGGSSGDRTPSGESSGNKSSGSKTSEDSPSGSGLSGGGSSDEQAPDNGSTGGGPTADPSADKGTSGGGSAATGATGATNGSGGEDSGKGGDGSSGAAAGAASAASGDGDGSSAAGAAAAANDKGAKDEKQ